MTLVTFCRLSCLTAVAAGTLLAVPVHTSPNARITTAPLVPSSAAPAVEPLFAQTGTVTRSPDNPHVIRRATTIVSEKAIMSGAVLTAEAHLLKLFPDVQFVAVRSRVETRPNRDYSWFGSIPGDEFGRVVVTVVGGKLGAMVTTRGRRYVVLPTADGGHEVLEIDDASYPGGNDVMADSALATVKTPPTTGTIRLDTTLAVPTPLDSGGLMRIVPWSLQPRDYDLSFKKARDDGSVIDVLAIYSHGAVTRTDMPPYSPPHVAPHAAPANLVTQIQLAIDEVNQTFENSGIHTRLNLLFTWEDTNLLDDGTSLEADLSTAAAQGGAASILREAFAADVVMIVTGTPDNELCGTSHRPSGHFAVKVLNECLVGNYVVAHEVGHLLGGAHDWYKHLLELSDPGTDDWDPQVDWNNVPDDWTLTQDNHGFVQIGTWETAIRTVMAEPHACSHFGFSCPRVGWWSNPSDLTQNNLPLGIPQGLPFPAHDVRGINERRITVANFRSSVCRFLPGC